MLLLLQEGVGGRLYNKKLLFHRPDNCVVLRGEIRYQPAFGGSLVTKSRPMDKPLPFTRFCFYTCVTALLLVIQLPLFSQTIYVSPSGNDVSGDGSAGNPFRTITHAVGVAASGNTVQLGSGTYNELVVINKSLTIDGVSNSLATVTYTGTISDYTTTGTVLPTLFKITAQNVTVQNINFIVNQNIVHSAVHTSGDASGLKVLNNKITASLTNIIPFLGAASTALAYARRNAIGINPGITMGASKYNYLNAGLTNIKIAGNFITGSTTAQNGITNANFRAGVHADYTSGLLVGGTVAEKNTIQTINQDVIVRFFTNGDVTIRNNEFNGGGVELSTLNGTTGTILVDSNYFNFLPPGVPAFPLLRLLNGNPTKTTIVRGNTFYNSNWYISIGNYNTVTVDSNIFIPVLRDPVAHNDFRLITVNSKVIQSGATTPAENNATFTSNQFYGVAGADGKAFAFYNHDAAGSSFGAYTVGMPGKENIFHSDISRFFYVDNSNGQNTTSLTGTYPEYGSGTFNTTTAYWTQDIEASQNRFDIGTGTPLKPDLMDHPQRLIMNSMVFDQLDDNNIGKVHLYNILLAAAPPRVAPAVDLQERGVTYRLYPNPVPANLFVRVITPKKQAVTLRLYTLSGVCLQTLSGVSNTTANIDMHKWPAGTYLVEFNTDYGRYVQQVVKL